MRAGACAAQQTLSAEAASVLKHSLSLARRRGHAQVTPLHVAATLLSSRASLLRRACLKSQPHQPSHPLQCRALELCFNVALNRLPATPGPLLHAQPSLSNALIAALKRAQAHQRRGCIEQQQQQQQQPPLIAIKVELEQLILSILDDPSVSRVMREAGFSSTSVKSNLEEAANSVSPMFQCYENNYIYGGIYSTPSSPPSDQNPISTAFWPQNPFLFSPQKKPVNNYITATDFHASSLKEDIKLVMEVLLGKNNNKRRNAVILGDILSLAEAVVAEIMSMVDRGDVPDELKSAKLVKFQLSSVPLKLMKREEVDMNVADLKRKVESFASSGGRVIIYIGDLKWTGDDDHDQGSGAGVYSPVDHLIREIGKLLSWFNNNNNNNGSNIRVWLMASANYQTYMKCQMKQPPLDVQWALQAVSVPSGGLGLSLNATSGRDSRISLTQSPSQVVDKKLFCVKEEEQDHVLTCCKECTSNYEKEAAFKSFSSHKDKLPFWLKPQTNDTLDHMDDDLAQLRRKYNKLCQSLHQNQHNSSFAIGNQSYLGRNNYYYTSSHPCNWPNKNNIFADHAAETVSFANYPGAVKPNITQTSSSLPRFRRQQSCHIEFSFSNDSSRYQSVTPNLDSLKTMEEKDVKITLALGNSMHMDDDDERIRDKMIAMIQENVPWQSETVPLILDTLLDTEGINRDKFILIQGNDAVGKRRLAFGIAESVFGSCDLLFCMSMRKNVNCSVTESWEMLEKALRKHKKLVILIEDFDYADPEFAKFLEATKMESWRRQNRDSGRGIFILATDGDPSCHVTRGEHMNSAMQMKLVVREAKHGTGSPNHERHKRKADWDSLNKSIKSMKTNEMEEVSSNGNRDTITKQLIMSSNAALDLNIKADDQDDDDNEGRPGEFSPISSDLTRETTIEQHNPLTSFLRKIKNRFVFNRNSCQDHQARDMFLSKFKKSFEEACGCSPNIRGFDIEETVLEEVYRGCGLYLNSLFEKWLKDIFQTSLGVVDNGVGDKVSVRLCLGGIKGDNSNWAKDGFMGTCLPKRIPVSFIG